MLRPHHSRLCLLARRRKISSSRNGVRIERTNRDVIPMTVTENAVARFHALHLDHG
jgi:hypothetical protein